MVVGWKSYGTEIALAVSKSAQRGVAGCWGKGSSRREGAPPHPAPDEASLREDADFDVWAPTETARPKCNNFPNCDLIFAVGEAPAVNSQP